MSDWTPPSEPPDLREQPECICPPEGPECPECPAHYEQALVRAAEARGRWMDRVLPESVYPVIRIRDAAGTLRTGYRPEAEDEPEADIEY